MDDILGRERESSPDDQYPVDYVLRLRGPPQDCPELEKTFRQYVQFEGSLLDLEKRNSAILAAAQVAFGSARAAAEWWTSPNADLGGNTPSNLVFTLAGTECIAEHLRRIAFGATKPITPERMGGGALRVFHNIARELGWTHAEEVGILRVPEATYVEWQAIAQAGNGLDVGPAIVERIGNVLGIYGEMETTHPGSHGAWLRRPNPNPVFGGRPPMELLMAVPDGLAKIRRYLEEIYGGWA